MTNYVIVEVDIAADGRITADPNPVSVASGQTLMFHINSNASEATKLSVDFPEGPNTPFGVTGHSESLARRCLGIGAPVDWPPGVESATVTLSAHGSPVFGKLDVVVFATAQAEPIASEGHGGHYFHAPLRDIPQISHNYYFGLHGGGDLHTVDSDWRTGVGWTDIANTTNCYRYKVTNKGPSEVTVKASPSGKKTHIKAGSSAYVECSKIEVKTRFTSGHAHGDIETA